jgi:hypothetical protein
MTTATTGTGTITLGSAFPSYRTFAAAGVVNNDVVRYVIEEGNAWEIGNGTYTATGTLMSRSLLASSTGSLLSLGGNAAVFVTATAEDFDELAPLASPALTGTPTAPTAAVGTNTTQIATTAFVNAEIANDAPTKTGGGASGNWGINITGSAGSTTVLNQIASFPTANNQDFNSLTTGGYYNIVWGNFTGTLNTPSNSANSYGTLLVQNGLNFTSQLYMPHATSSSPATRVLYNGSWTAWAYTLSSANYTSYAPSLTGSGASGNWGINITGNAATATTADQIDGIGFRNTGSNSAVNADTLDSNGITYYTAGVPNFTGNATDGALYSQAYSSSWQHQIAADYRSGQIALRGKNSGTWQSWRTVLDSSNYTSYAPSLTGSGASGTWGISITGNALSSTLSVIQDTRSGALTPNDYSDYRVTYEFTNQVIGGDWHSAITPKGWTDGYAAWQIWGPSSTSAHENWYLRSGINTTWNPLRTILHSGNYGSYALPLAGGTVTGDITMSGTGMIKVPVGTTAQRPGTPALGMIRFNSTRGCYEGYTASGWVNMSPINFDDIGAIA